MMRKYLRITMAHNLLDEKCTKQKDSICYLQLSSQLRNDNVCLFLALGEKEGNHINIHTLCTLKYTA